MEAREESNSVPTVDYDEFFVLAVPKPRSTKDCSARCKLCGKTYKYTPTSKGNLLKHLQSGHRRELDAHKSEREKLVNVQDEHVVSRANFTATDQDIVLTSIVTNLCGCGGLPIGVVEQEWLRQFMVDVEPRFNHVSRVAVQAKLDSLYQQHRDALLNEISCSPKPTVTLDLWTSRDNRSFMGCTIHYYYEKQIKHHMLFFQEVPPPHTAENIRIYFEDALDRCHIKCYYIVTDNAANMK